MQRGSPLTVSGAVSIGNQAGNAGSAVQQEVEREQRTLDLFYARLDELRDRTLQALRTLRAAPIVPTPGGRAERDAFDALHTQRLAQLQAVEDRLAFGRLDLAGGARRYIGRVGLSDDEQAQLLIDWRAPAASTFYQATAAAPDMSLFMSSMPLAGLIDRPPESNVMPLPIRATCFDAPSGR